MDQDVFLLVVAGAISLISGLISGSILILVTHRLTRKLWFEQKEIEKREDTRNRLTGSISELKTLLQDDVLGTLRSMSEAPERGMLLTQEMGNLEISKDKLIQVLSQSQGDLITVQEVANISIETLDPDTE
ncbi:hypothetical protein [Candidatus Leptofilum sp.]|uniref:hypothetical protein n=1 Tax=Candidatus Leptofilum sp. TaxID=3241576 RepID=UPI003B595871